MRWNIVVPVLLVVVIAFGFGTLSGLLFEDRVQLIDMLVSEDRILEFDTESISAFSQLGTLVVAVVALAYAHGQWKENKESTEANWQALRLMAESNEAARKSAEISRVHSEAQFRCYLNISGIDIRWGNNHPNMAVALCNMGNSPCQDIFIETKTKFYYRLGKAGEQQQVDVITKFAINRVCSRPMKQKS